jgi:Ca2+-dependent lipid-binding protein
MWTPAHTYDLDDVHILKTRRGGHCQIKFGHGSDTQVREVNFDSEKEASSFRQVISHLRDLQSKRTELRVREFTKSPDSKPDSPSASTSQIQLLVEIVSGTRLPIADGSSSDPYVIVRMAGEEVHRTKPLYNT